MTEHTRRAEEFCAGCTPQLRRSGVATRPTSPPVSLRTRRSPREPDAIVLVVSGSIRPAAVSGLCRRARRLLLGAGEARFVYIDVGALADIDAVTVEAVARLQLTVRRLGRRLRLRSASAELTTLASLMGLAGFLGEG
jgi:ABC-type transporter Mla MlaB component